MSSVLFGTMQNMVGSCQIHACRDWLCLFCFCFSFRFFDGFPLVRTHKTQLTPMTWAEFNSLTCSCPLLLRNTRASSPIEGDGSLLSTMRWLLCLYTSNACIAVSTSKHAGALVSLSSTTQHGLPMARDFQILCCENKF